MLGVAGPLCWNPPGVNSLLFPASILISLTSLVTPSKPDLGAGAAEAAESEGDELPLVLGTNTAAATLRALRAPLSGLDVMLVPPLVLLGDVAGDPPEAAESAEENCATGDFGVCAAAFDIAGEADAWSNGQPSF